VPVFLDSGSNHSLGMDLSLLALEGLNADTSPTRDILESAALSIHTQPQLNIFLGEGGPRNFTQTTAPTASEIFDIPFQGSAGCIKFTTADERTGGISGQVKPKLFLGENTSIQDQKEIEVWGEYTLTAPDVIAFVAGKVSRKPRRLMNELDDVLHEFLGKVKQHETERIAKQRELKEQIRSVITLRKRRE